MDRRDLRHPAEGPERAFAGQGRRPGPQGGKNPCRAHPRKISRPRIGWAARFAPPAPGFYRSVARFLIFIIIGLDCFPIFGNTGCAASPTSLERRRVSFMQYFVVMIDYGRRGREAVVDPEITRREVIARVASGEYKNISFIHEIADAAVDDITAEILAEAAVPEIAVTGADLQADRFDHARDLRKHEAV